MRQSPRPSWRFLLVEQRGHDRHHVGVAAEMIGFHEGAVRLFRHVAQMGEVDRRRNAAPSRARRWFGPAPSEPVQKVTPLARHRRHRG